MIHIAVFAAGAVLGAVGVIMAALCMADKKNEHKTCAHRLRKRYMHKENVYAYECVKCGAVFYKA